MIIRVHIPQQIPVRQSGSWNLNFHTPPHSPNLAPLNYHMFGWLKEVSYGQRFVIDDEVKDFVQIWLHSQLTFFVYGRWKFINCYTIHVKKGGVYIAYIHTTISYGIIFWGNSSAAKNVFLLQKKILRCIANKKPRDSCRVLF